LKILFSGLSVERTYNFKGCTGLKMLEPVSKNDDFFNKCLERMRSTISIQYEGDVDFNDYKISQVCMIEKYLFNSCNTKQFLMVFNTRTRDCFNFI
jgi:hypothetical protein